MNTPVAAVDKVWQQIREETAEEVQREPVLASFLHATILNHDALEDALSFHLAQMLASPAASALLVREVIDKAFAADTDIRCALRADLCAVLERDSACSRLSVPFLYFKGYHALQSYGYRTGCGSTGDARSRCSFRIVSAVSSAWIFTRQRRWDAA